MAAAAKLARFFFDGAAEGLRLDGAELQAKKCAAMATNPKLRKMLRAAMAGTGVLTPLCARDLGVDAGPGLRRVAIQAARVNKAVKRAPRVAHIGLRGKHRGVQGSSLVASTALFGVETTGMAASVRKTLRVAMAKQSALVGGLSSDVDCPP